MIECSRIFDLVNESEFIEHFINSSMNSIFYDQAPWQCLKFDNFSAKIVA